MSRKMRRRRRRRKKKTKKRKSDDDDENHGNDEIHGASVKIGTGRYGTRVETPCRAPASQTAPLTTTTTTKRSHEIPTFSPVL